MTKKVPILFIIFNRLDTTKEVFEAIKEYQPDKLYISSDAARDHIPGENEIVQSTRDYVLNNITWECEIKTFFRDTNVGCGRGVSEPISWMFKYEEVGIILEDDCLPSPNFFPYCEEMLIRYKDNKQVMTIGGFNNQGFGISSDNYIFTRYIAVWGWATWKRAWEKFENREKYWDKVVSEKLHYQWFSKIEGYLRMKNWKPVFESFSSWGYMWFVTCLYNNGLTVLPKSNLIRNIGIGDDSTHTKIITHDQKNMRYGNIKFPLQIATPVQVNKKYENRLQKNYLRNKLFSFIKMHIK